MPIEAQILETGVIDDEWVDGTSLSNFSAQSVALTSKIPSAPNLLDWNLSPQANNEDIDVYSDRLTRIAQRLAELISDDEANIGAITLQGVPNDDAWRRHFLDALEAALGEEAAKWKLNENLFHTATHNSEYGNLTLVNSELFEVTGQPDLGPEYDVDEEEEEDEEEKNIALSRYTAQATDLKLKKRNPEDPDVQFRLVNVHLTENAAREDLERLYTGYTGQVVVAGQFGKGEDVDMDSFMATGSNEVQLSHETTNGFHFRHNPERFEFSRPVLPLVETESPFPSKIKYSTLADTFTKQGFNVTRDTARDLVTITSADKKDKVEIKKTTTDRLSFTANNSSDQALKTMSEAMALTLEKGTKIKIEVKCADPGRNAEVEEVKNKMWLDYVKKGFDVEGPLPSETFREANRAALTALPGGEEKFFPRAAPAPGR